MENASKALVIAGSIIITLVIVALGVLVVNRLRSTIVNSSNVNEQQIQYVNGKFESYFGNNVKASDVKQLIRAVSAHDITVANDEESEDLPVYIIFEGATKTLYGVSMNDAAAGNAVAGAGASFKEPSSLISTIKQGKHYNVKANNESRSDADVKATDTDCAGYYKNGYIKCIYIKQAAE